jgi:hypothetical protein
LNWLNAQSKNGRKRNKRNNGQSKQKPSYKLSEIYFENEESIQTNCDRN